MKAAEIRKLTTEELRSKLRNPGGELFNLRFQFAISQFDSPVRISTIKKDIVRTKTILRDNKLKDSART